jgi:hypothetical protein
MREYTPVATGLSRYPLKPSQVLLPAEAFLFYLAQTKLFSRSAHESRGSQALR